MFSPEELKKKRVGILMGGLSAEREVSTMSGKAILEVLLSLGYEALAIDGMKSFRQGWRKTASKQPSSACTAGWERTAQFRVLEVNTLPGKTPLSLFPEIAKGTGLDFPHLVERILAGAGLKVRMRGR